MHVSEQAKWPPHLCALTGTSSGPFVVTDVTLPGFDPRVQVSVAGLKKTARDMAGMVDGEVHQAVLDRISELESELDAVRVELEKSERLVEAIDVIESADFRARKKTGRPKKEPVNE